MWCYSGLVSESCVVLRGLRRQADGAAQHRWTQYAPSKELYEAWLALPLIVLAGLR
jgi:hypothetical protein